MQRRASDIHIEAADRSTRVKFRVDGILVPAMEPLDIRLHAPLVSRLKVMSDLDIAERRVPQDGSFRMRLERKTVDFRVSILPSVFGESVVIRIWTGKRSRPACRHCAWNLSASMRKISSGSGKPSRSPMGWCQDGSDRQRKNDDALPPSPR